MNNENNELRNPLLNRIPTISPRKLDKMYDENEAVVVREADFQRTNTNDMHYFVRKDSVTANENWHTFITSITEGEMFGSVFCLLCLTFGSAILALPYSITKTGLILGFLLFFFASYSVLWTLRMLIKVAIKNNTLDYSGLINIYFGKNQTFFYQLMNLTSNLGTIIIYQQIISNFILSVLSYVGIKQITEYPNLSRFIQMNVLALFTQVPITFIKHIEVLHKISYLGTLSLLYSVIVALVEFPFYFMENYNYSRLLFFKFDWNIIKVLCVYFFAFANHNAILNILTDLKNPNKKRCMKVLSYSFNIEFYVYMIVILVGYLSTFENTKEIFVDRPGQSIFMIIGKLLYGISLTCHIGLYYYISRPGLEVMLNDSEQFTEKQNMFFGCVIILTLNLVAYMFESIVSLISFFGATVNIYIVFIMPILMYLKCTEGEIEKYRYHRYLAILLLIIACSIGGIYVITLVFDSFIDVY